jgi:sarcosine oxidase
MPETFDFAIVGAGVFGAWCAHELLDRGYSVVLLEMHGPAHSRASSGGESRIIRMGYGPDELYTRWSMQSLREWQALSQRLRTPVFHRTGMLWLAGADDSYVRQTQATLRGAGVAQQRLTRDELAQKFPQFHNADIAWALWEPGSGVLMARQAVQALVTDCLGRGLEYRHAHVLAPESRANFDKLATTGGGTISAGSYVFACGPWLPKLFPELLAPRIFPSRQEIYFFATPPGDDSFGVPAMPAWFHHPELVYGLPDLEHRGVKISIDRHGPAFDPDNGLRIPTEQGMTAARAYLERRFPKLEGAALVESRVCQYENTANGDFLIDRHPQFDNVVIAGGGSGHGFKHGPAVGDYVARLLTAKLPPEPRFSLAQKAAAAARSVY